MIINFTTKYEMENTFEKAYHILTEKELRIFWSRAQNVVGWRPDARIAFAWIPNEPKPIAVRMKEAYTEWRKACDEAEAERDKQLEKAALEEAKREKEEERKKEIKGLVKDFKKQLKTDIPYDSYNEHINEMLKKWYTYLGWDKIDHKDDPKCPSKIEIKDIDPLGPLDGLADIMDKDEKETKQKEQKGEIDMGQNDTNNTKTIDSAKTYKEVIAFNPPVEWVKAKIEESGTKMGSVWFNKRENNELRKMSYRLHVQNPTTAKLKKADYDAKACLARAAQALKDNKAIVIKNGISKKSSDKLNNQMTVLDVNKVVSNVDGTKGRGAWRTIPLEKVTRICNNGIVYKIERNFN